MKRSFFQAAVVSILLYGCTTRTLTKRLEKKPDANYTRMLRAILNKSWRHHLTRHQLYGHLPSITKDFARPYVGVHRSTSLMSSSLLLQQCPAFLVRLTWIVFVMGGRWTYSWCFIYIYIYIYKQNLLLKNLHKPQPTN